MSNVSVWSELPVVVLYYSPWKTASTNLVNYLEKTLNTKVVKETFHEDRYESSVVNEALDDEWSRFSCKPTAYPVKYSLELNKLLQSEQIGHIAEAISDFLVTTKSSVVFQIAESPHICVAIKKKLDEKGIDSQVFAAEYSNAMQELSILHNYFEGNSYFIANLLLFYFTNKSGNSFLRFRRFLYRLSNTGAIRFCEVLASLMPDRFVTYFIEYYQTQVEDILPKLTKIESITGNPGYDPGAMAGRYKFLMQKYWNDRGVTNSTEVEQWLNRISFSRAVLNLMDAPKKLSMSEIRSGVALYKIQLDRCFIRNMRLTEGGYFVPNNPDEPSCVSTDLGPNRFVLGIAAISEADFSIQSLNIDGIRVAISLDESLAGAVPDCSDGTAKKAYAVHAMCRKDVYIEVMCSTFPEIYLLVSLDNLSVNEIV